MEIVWSDGHSQESKTEINQEYIYLYLSCIASALLVRAGDMWRKLAAAVAAGYQRQQWREQCNRI